MSIDSSVVDFDLDLSWANKYQTLNNIDSHHKCEPMQDLNLYFVFIDNNNSIQHIECNKEPIIDLSDSSRGIHKDRLLQIIQSKKSMTKRKFKLFHMLLFHVDIQPENIPDFIARDNEFSSFVKNPSCLSDLIIPDSLFVFHDVNSLFIFFSENKQDKVGLTRKVFDSSNHRKTKKKVSFSL